MNRILRATLGLSCVIAATAVSAQGAWPNRPLKIVVPVTQGGSNDILARLLGDRLTNALGQPVVVENRPGGGGVIGTEYVARQPADGYTLLVVPNNHVYNQHFIAKLPYDPLRDFEPITLAAVVPFVLAVPATLPAQNAREMVDLGKRTAKGLSYGSAGLGQPHHLAAEWLKSMTGANFVHVPYKGAAGIVPALVAHEIDFTIGAINSLLPHFRSGKLRALAVASSKRTALLPDVPTLAEAVPVAGYGMDVWVGLVTVAGTPRDVVLRLNTEINRILQDPQVVKERLLPLGIEPITSTPERFAEVMKADTALYTKIVQDAGIRRE